MTVCLRQMTGFNNTIADAFSRNGQGSVFRDRAASPARYTSFFFVFLNVCLLLQLA